jgi:hypothetical protein
MVCKVWAWELKGSSGHWIGIDGGCLGSFVAPPSFCRSGSRFSRMSLRSDRVEWSGVSWRFEPLSRHV